MNHISAPPSLDWIRIDKCPICDSVTQSFRRVLLRSGYDFVGEDIPFPIEGVAVARCADCGLVYKTIIPSPTFLAGVFTRHANELWNNPYDFASELKVIESLFPGREFDLLDIGPSDGGLLKACAQMKGRRAGLDIVKYPGLEQWLRGEFIDGLIDNPSLAWSGRQYDVVTMFDVVEHLYQPLTTFKNLNLLVKKDGYAIIETGNIESYIPVKWGANQWWYTNLFEHHIFWTTEALEKVAIEYGFRLVFRKTKRHKQLSKQSIKAQVYDTMKFAFYAINPSFYRWLMKKIGKSIIQPWNAIAKDHMLIILQKS